MTNEPPPAAASPPVLFRLADGLARITLNRPQKLNSFTADVHAHLRAALAQTAQSDARVLLIDAAGRGFCAGQDLAERRVAEGAPPVDLGAAIETNLRPLVLALRALPMPVICAVQGVAAGAGANLALACDIVIAARSAYFVQSFCRLGLVPDAGGTWNLPRRVGLARALGLSLLGEELSAEDAERWGLIWKCVDDAQLSATVETLAARLAQAPTQGLARTKAALYASAGNTLDEQLALERDYQRELGFGADYREGVAAFFEKRPPRFTGKP